MIIVNVSGVIAAENSSSIAGINDILQDIHIENIILNCNYISQHYCFYCIFGQINAALVSSRAVQLIEFDSHAHLVSKAGSVIGGKSPSPVFKRSGS